MTPQARKILALLKRKAKVTNRELNHICFRYGARIYDLRKLGYIIETSREGLGFYSFRLISQPR